jgi:hypothetical protein
MKSKSEGGIQRGGHLPQRKKTAKGSERQPLRKARRQPAPACASCDRPIVDRICFSAAGVGSRGCPTLVQAKLLNQEKTQFNILLGLCVGHDSLFFKYGAAPTTVLAVKDRVTGHNPLAAIYLSDSYYRKIKTVKF